MHRFTILDVNFTLVFPKMRASDLLEKLLSEDHVLTHREIDEEVSAAPQWAHCMEDELQQRREAINCVESKLQYPKCFVDSVPTQTKSTT